MAMTDEEEARWRAQMDGGEWRDYLDEIRRSRRGRRGSNPPKDGGGERSHAESREYNDEDLTGIGYRLTKAYDYTTPKGRLLYQSVRYEHPEIPKAKKFLSRRPNPKLSGNFLFGAPKIKVLYRWPDVANNPDAVVHVPEGEKNCDTLAEQGKVATTVAGQNWSPEAVAALKGRHIVIYPDCDPAGEENADDAVDALRPVAASIRLVKLPGLAYNEDVTDWLKSHTITELDEIVAQTPCVGLRASPFLWVDPQKIPTRQWLLKPNYVRGFVSVTISTGGIGKSSLVIAEAMAMAAAKSGKTILAIPPEGAFRVWYVNGEDPLDEIQRRVAATAMHYGIAATDIGDRLCIDSGRDKAIVIAIESKRQVILNEAIVQDMIATIRDRQIDVLILDPFISFHRVNENDNAATELVVKALARIAEEANCAVHVVHHARKTGGNSATVDDGRGASALLAAGRAARVLNKMTEAEADRADIDPADRWRYIRSDIGKANLSRPAERADWYQLVSVDLGNSPDPGWAPSDEVGVIEPWGFPVRQKLTLTACDIARIQAAVRAGGPWRLSSQSRREPWVGLAVAGVMGIDPERRKDLNPLVSELLAQGYLKEVPRADGHRDSRPYVVVGDKNAAPDEVRRDPEVSDDEET